MLEEVPVEYEEYKSVFDEIECNELPPHRIYDCKIKLKDKDNLFYGPLYPLTEEERTALKEYIKENLEKGFIRPSNSLAGTTTRRIHLKQEYQMYSTILNAYGEFFLFYTRFFTRSKNDKTNAFISFRKSIKNYLKPVRLFYLFEKRIKLLDYVLTTED